MIFKLTDVPMRKSMRFYPPQFVTLISGRDSRSVIPKMLNSPISMAGVGERQRYIQWQVVDNVINAEIPNALFFGGVVMISISSEGKEDLLKIHTETKLSIFAPKKWSIVLNFCFFAYFGYLNRGNHGVLAFLFVVFILPFLLSFLRSLYWHERIKRFVLLEV